MQQPNYYHSTETVDLFPAESYVYGDFGERLVASIFDGLILLIPAYTLSYILGEIEGSLASIVLNWLYFALQESGLRQATIGKKAMGLKVISEDGSRISFAQASGRFFGRYLSAIILFIGYFMMFWNPKKQTLHDTMAGTLIIKN